MIYVCMYIHARICIRCRVLTFALRIFRSTPWPLHDIVLTDIVWCAAYKWEVGRGVVYCPIVVQ